MNHHIQTRTLAAGRARALATMLLIAATSCNDAEPTASPTPALTTVDVTLGSSSIEVGQFTAATAVALDQFAEPLPASTTIFSSSNPDIAGVSPSTGTIFAISPGTALITATIDGRSGQRPITVQRAPAVRVNEVQSNGDAPGGWIELLNTTATPVDLSGWTLTDGNVFHGVSLPAGTIIAAHGYLVLDEATLPVGLGAADGVHLFSRYGVLVDSYAWTTEPATTYGRCPDGFGDFVVTVVPTKGDVNTCSPARAR